jgi:hypothetical protein
VLEVAGAYASVSGDGIVASELVGGFTVVTIADGIDPRVTLRL